VARQSALPLAVAWHPYAARASPAFRIVVTRTLSNPCQGVQ